MFEIVINSAVENEMMCNLLFKVLIFNISKIVYNKITDQCNKFILLAEMKNITFYNIIKNIHPTVHAISNYY